MATVQLDHSWNPCLLQNPAAEQILWSPSLQRPLLQGLGRMFRQAAGLAMLLAGAAMLFTFWLIPIGLPLALLGLATTSAEA